MSMEEDPDIVQVIIQACQSSGLDAAAAHEIKLRIRAQYGGLRVSIPKRKQHPTRQERELVVADGVTHMSNEELWQTRHQEVDPLPDDEALDLRFQGVIVACHFSNSSTGSCQPDGGRSTM